MSASEVIGDLSLVKYHQAAPKALATIEDFKAVYFSFVIKISQRDAVSLAVRVGMVGIIGVSIAAVLLRNCFGA